MKSKIYIGIDNGVSGSIGVIRQTGESLFLSMPNKSEQDYTKKKANITRVDHKFLKEILDGFVEKDTKLFFMLERPMVNPTRFVATKSALRCLEAVLIVIEQLDTDYSIVFCDSKEWQKLLLPNGSKAEQLKKDSMTIGIRLFSEWKHAIEKHKDADGILIAEYCRRLFK
jgi:hypothetical protein